MAATILVVDDEYAIVESLEELLEEEGYRVVTAANGVEALERVRHDHPQLLLMDVMMPLLDGVEALRQLRADPASATLPAVLMSAAPDSIIEGVEMPAISAFIGKPIDIGHLLELIANLIRS